MAHLSGNPTWTNTLSTPVTSAALENVENQIDVASENAEATWLATDQGFAGWTYDWVAATTAVTLTSGVVRLTSVKVGAPTTLTTASVVVTTAGATLTSGACFIGLYDTSYNRLAVSADMSTSLNATGYVSATFTSSVTVNPGQYHVTLLVNGTTMPAVLCASINLNVYQAHQASGVTYRQRQSTATYTTLPTSLPTTGYSAQSTYVWAEVH